MQAQRKLEEPEVAAAVVADEPWVPSGDIASPTHLLWEELAARLQPAPAAVPVTTAHLTPKWPVPARITIVVGMSMMCWVGIYMAASALL